MWELFCKCILWVWAAFWLVVVFHNGFHLLQREASSMRTTLSCGKKNTDLEYGKGWCFFSKMATAGSLPRSITLLALGSWLVLRTRKDFLLVEKVLSSIREILVTTKLCMPLLHPYALLVIVVAHRSHSWIRLLAASFLWKLACCPLVSWKLVVREQAYRSVLAHRPCVWSNKYLSSTSGGNWKQ